MRLGLGKYLKHFGNEIILTHGSDNKKVEGRVIMPNKLCDECKRNSGIYWGDSLCVDCYQDMLKDNNEEER